MSINMMRILNVCFFYIIWWGTVASINFGLTFVPPIITLIILILHLVIIPNARNEIVFIGCCILLGAIVELAYINSNLLSYYGYYIFDNQFPPLWTVCMWISLALTINHSMVFLRKRWLAIIICGSIFGPICYISLMKFNIIQFHFNLGVSIFILSMVCSINLLLMYYLIQIIEENMEIKYLFTVGLIILVAMGSIAIAKNKGSQYPVDPVTSFYEIEAKSIFGETISMETYKGKKILIVNVASKCGLTNQYAELEKLYNTYSDKLVILGFPSNDFLKQEPGSNKEIASFCSTNYSVSFPLFEKIIVKGRKMHDIYRWLSDPSQNGWNSSAPSWNFTKYLIDENGKLVKRFSPRSTPMSSDIVDLIK